MKKKEIPVSSIVFGPVPSRRLGRSLGVNNIPPKICTYSCVYCQLGRTVNFSSERQEFYDPQKIFSLVRSKTEEAADGGQKIEYITFVPDGEPTLDAGLGAELKLVGTLGLKTAVITNSSLMDLEDVRSDLMEADLVCLKADAVHEEIWTKMNRPAKKIKLCAVMDGILKFSKAYKGVLITDTMLVSGLNDGAEHINALTGFLTRVGASKNYISVVTRPPAEEWVKKPSEERLNAAYQAVNRATGRAEFNINYEGDDFSFMSDAGRELLGIISVHPMRKEAVMRFLGKAGADMGLADELARRGEIVKTAYDGMEFYIRKIKRIER
ncbi:MAG: hypothetical protein ACD_47C00228G0003 [uncultured bacterium]|uniref:Radical SAM protein n=1 Tax=Candidatus Wallbacteria bacterium GWC2_49_35 TaxID=1817813 RepID=A0A1F7WU38_9BACT|nr:MAG: hypothetical protein ACD_47C00228G0003 [uncultured bacterium]OGM06316.1 MAG: radical SAM protein [Candidatus Wallbacteria bacterium GWC2_49_35]HBC73362.1 radical SAM protein [Candidatus Wallbacteria bacterium]